MGRWIKNRVNEIKSSSKDTGFSEFYLDSLKYSDTNELAVPMYTLKFSNKSDLSFSLIESVIISNKKLN